MHLGQIKHKKSAFEILFGCSWKVIFVVFMSPPKFRLKSYMNYWPFQQILHLWELQKPVDDFKFDFLFSRYFCQSTPFEENGESILTLKLDFKKMK